MYFKNDYEQAVIRSVPYPNFTMFVIKFKGQKEFVAKKGSSVIVDVLTEQNRITKEEYDNF